MKFKFKIQQYQTDAINNTVAVSTISKMMYHTNEIFTSRYTFAGTY